MLKEWQRQFSGTRDSRWITPQIMAADPEKKCLQLAYNFLFKCIHSHPAYLPLMREIIKARDATTTPTIVKMIITVNYQEFFHGTEFEGAIHSSTGFSMVDINELIHQDLDYQKVMLQKLQKFKNQHDKGFAELKEIISNNLKTHLQKNPAVTLFPLRYFNLDVNVSELDNTQYTIWARHIINTQRNQLLAYDRNNVNVFQARQDMDNITLEKIVTTELRALQPGSPENHAAIIATNLNILLQEFPELIQFPLLYFQKGFNFDSISENQYTIWCRRIINTHRQKLLEFQGFSLKNRHFLNEMSNVELEKITRPALEKTVHAALGSLQDIVLNNLAIMFRDNKDLWKFPQERFKEKFDINNITDDQYKIWSQALVNEHKNALYAYGGKNTVIHLAITNSPATKLQQYVTDALRQLLEGS